MNYIKKASLDIERIVSKIQVASKFHLIGVFINQGILTSFELKIFLVLQVIL